VAERVTIIGAGLGSMTDIYQSGDEDEALLLTSTKERAMEKVAIQVSQLPREGTDRYQVDALVTD